MKQDNNAISIASVLCIFFTLIKNHEAEPFKEASKKYSLRKSKVYFTFLLYILTLAFNVSNKNFYSHNR